MGHEQARAVHRWCPALVDRLPFVVLADGLPTPVEEVAERLWIQRDDRSSSRYGGNKVRKLEHVLPAAVARGGPVLTAGATGSHHVLATVLHGRSLGLRTHAVVFPQPDTPDSIATAAELDRLAADGVLVRHRIPTPYVLPVGLAAVLGRLRLRHVRAEGRPTLVLPGASSPLGCVGHVSAGLELVEAFARAGWEEPDAVVAAFGSGGTVSGLALGTSLGGWHRCRVHAVRATDAIAANIAVARTLVTLTGRLLVRHGAPRHDVGRAVGEARRRLVVDAGYFEGTYGAPSPRAVDVDGWAAPIGVETEPTYTARATVAARDLVAGGERVVLHHTFAGMH